MLLIGSRGIRLGCIKSVITCSEPFILKTLENFRHCFSFHVASCNLERHIWLQITHCSILYQMILSKLNISHIFYFQVPQAKALYSYRGHNPGELKFNKGDIIILHRQLDENWYLGEINGVNGVFPTNSVQVIKQLPQPLPLCRALYNFDLKSRNKNEKSDCLTFHKVSLAFTRQEGRSHYSMPS